ncbi:acyl dehydratase [Variovorax boronicumulans]|uniref:MaoC family dehydratase n=1 Tax=Variovorax boronicumulans TaxID=436515 RepID=UPI00278A9D8D|nr:MaoC family dehydratase [Variovorax boronicumulans]MDQ0080222.1 acyl dehydratase [Variovorax boronicumulans]
MVEFEIAALAPIGPGYHFSRSHTFDEAQVKAFALAAGDLNPLHHDAEFARGTRFGGLIASGTHTASLLMGLTASHFAERGTVLGINFSVDLLRPVLASETVSLEWNVTSIAGRSKGGCILELQGSMRGADDRTSVLAHGTVLFTPD